MAAAPRLTAAEVAALPKDAVESSKREAARRAVDEYVRDGMAIGVGSGSTIVYAIQRLAERAQGAEALRVRCVPTSFQARQLCADTGLPLADLSQCPQLDVAIDGADEVDPQLALIKGGGGCQTQEKIVAAAAARFVVIADSRKRSRQLLTAWRKGVPVEVLPLALEPVRRALAAMGGKPVLRMGAPAKAGPAVTDNGGLILDVDFGDGSGLPGSPAEWHARIKGVPGVIETGIFPPGMAEAAYFGEEDGSVTVLRPQ